MIRTHSLKRERWAKNRPPKGTGGPRLGSLDKGWCCHERRLNDSEGPVAELVGIEGGVVSGVFNLESSDVGASDRRPRHEESYHEV